MRAIRRRWTRSWALGPQVLVVAGKGRAVLRQDQAQAPAADQVRVGEVLKHLRDRPLTRRLGGAQRVA